MTTLGQTPRYVTRTEAHQLFASARNDRDRFAMELLWYTGGRVSEVIRLRVGDLIADGLRMVNLKQGRYRRLADGTRVHERVPSEKHVFVPADFVERIRQRVAGLPLDAYLLGRTDGGPLTARRVRQIVERAGRDADVAKQKFATGRLRWASPHDFRHGNAVNMIIQGVPAPVVQAQLGHATLASTQHYLSIADPLRRELVGRAAF